MTAGDLILLAVAFSAAAIAGWYGRRYPRLSRVLFLLAFVAAFGLVVWAYKPAYWLILGRSLAEAAISRYEAVLAILSGFLVGRFAYGVKLAAARRAEAPAETTVETPFETQSGSPWEGGRVEPWPGAPEVRPPEADDTASGSAVRRRFGTVPRIAAALVLVYLATLATTGGHADATRSAGKPTLRRDPISGERLVRLVTSNQIVFEGRGKSLRAVCRCGPTVPLYKIGRNLRNAVVAFEDRRFRYHNGTDPIAKLRALWVTFASLGGRIEGGSTLTEQLIKNLTLHSGRDLGRKWREMWTARDLESQLDKNAILATYLNRTVFGYSRGRPIVGVEQASRFYFGRAANELSLMESATLAGILGGPGIYNPFRHPGAARNRATNVLSAMRAQGFITAADMRRALRSKRPRGRRRLIAFDPRGYVKWVVDGVRERFPDLGFDRRVRIPISLQATTQAGAEAGMHRAFRRRRDLRGVEAGFVTLARDGRVLAMVGQRNYSRYQFNTVTQARRQPASVFKVVVYASALENRVARPSRRLASDLAVSDNDRARALTERLGPRRIIETARKMGISSPLRPVPSIALGTSEVSLLEMTAAVGAVRTGGIRVKPFGAWGVVRDGIVLDWREPQPRVRALSRRTARHMHKMLRGVVTHRHGTGWRARAIADAAGKTGTGDDFRDAWFVGYSAGHISGLWLGKPDFSPMRHVDGTRAAGIWSDIERALPNARVAKSGATS